MESTLNDLKSRRSIRNFQDRQISDEELQKKMCIRDRYQPNSPEKP